MSELLLLSVILWTIAISVYMFWSYNTVVTTYEDGGSFRTIPKLALPGYLLFVLIQLAFVAAIGLVILYLPYYLFFL